MTVRDEMFKKLFGLIELVEVATCDGELLTGEALQQFMDPLDKLIETVEYYCD